MKTRQEITKTDLELLRYVLARMSDTRLYQWSEDVGVDYGVASNWRYGHDLFPLDERVVADRPAIRACLSSALKILGEYLSPSTGSRTFGEALDMKP